MEKVYKIIISAYRDINNNGITKTAIDEFLVSPIIENGSSISYKEIITGEKISKRKIIQNKTIDFFCLYDMDNYLKKGNVAVEIADEQNQNEIESYIKKNNREEIMHRIYNLRTKALRLICPNYSEKADKNLFYDQEIYIMDIYPEDFLLVVPIYKKGLFGTQKIKCFKEINSGIKVATPTDNIYSFDAYMKGLEKLGRNSDIIYIDMTKLATRELSLKEIDNYLINSYLNNNNFNNENKHR